MTYFSQVSFHIGSTEGLVIFMARKTASADKLAHTTNEDYLTHATLLIGSAYALRLPRLAAERERRLESQQTLQQVRTKIKSLSAMKRNIQSFVEKESVRSTQKQKNNVNDLGNEVTEYPHDPVCCSFVFSLTKQTEKKIKSCYTKFFGVQTPPS